MYRSYFLLCCVYYSAALEKAEVLLSMNHGMAHLDNIWGCGGGNRPVVSLTNKARLTTLCADLPLNLLQLSWLKYIVTALAHYHRCISHHVSLLER